MAAAVVENGGAGGAHHRLRIVVVGSSNMGKTRLVQGLLALDDLQSITAPAARTRKRRSWRGAPRPTVETRHLSCCEINVHLRRERTAPVRTGRRQSVSMRPPLGLVQDELLHDVRYSRIVRLWRRHITNDDSGDDGDDDGDDVPDGRVAIAAPVCAPCPLTVACDDADNEVVNVTSDDENEEPQDGGTNAPTDYPAAADGECTVLRTLVGYELYDTAGDLWSDSPDRISRYVNGADVIFAVYDPRNDQSIRCILRLLATMAPQRSGSLLSMTSRRLPPRTKSVVLTERCCLRTCRHCEDLGGVNNGTNDRYFNPNAFQSLRYYYDDVEALDASETDWCRLSEKYDRGGSAHGRATHHFFVRLHSSACGATTNSDAAFLQRVLAAALEPVVRNRYHLSRSSSTTRFAVGRRWPRSSADDGCATVAERDHDDRDGWLGTDEVLDNAINYATSETADETPMRNNDDDAGGGAHLVARLWRYLRFH